MPAYVLHPEQGPAPLDAAIMRVMEEMMMMIEIGHHNFGWGIQTNICPHRHSQKRQSLKHLIGLFTLKFVEQNKSLNQ